MKILHVITTLYTGGAEKLMVDLLPRLKAAGHEADLCIFDGSRTPFYEEITAKGIKVIDFGVGNSVYNPKNILKLRKLVRNYDIIHTHNTSPQFFAALANIGIGKNLITTEHNTHNRRRNLAGFSSIDRWMYNQYQSVICISDKAEENLREFINNDTQKINVIYNGIDVAKFSEAPKSDELEAIASDAKKVVMVAAFRPQKDQQTLIKAIQYLPENFHLYLIGEGECLQECKNLTESLGLSARVHFMGRRSNIGELLKAGDYIVMSSHYEGLSLSSIEGMSVGKPFLASDVDGLREVVQGFGVLFPHEDEKALASEILNLDKTKEEYNRVAGACYQRALQFDISKMVEGYLNTYRSI